MSDDLPPPAPEPALQAAATDAVAKAEAAATRRRWINLGEFVAVAGLIIAGIGLWLNWSDRRADMADKQAEKTAEIRQQSRYIISGTVGGKGDVTIQRDEHHMLGDITVAFPAALGIAPQTSPTQTIAKGWYEAALLKATEGEPHRQTGTLPVALTVHYFDNDKPLVASGTYDIVWKTESGGLLGHVFGRSLHVIGFKRRGGAIGQAALDAAWNEAHPPR